MTTRVVRYQGKWTNYVHLGCSICAAQSQDGTRIASSATHGQCLIRDANSGDVLVRLNGHWNSVGWIAWSANDRFVATACADGTARIWNPANGEQQFILPHRSAVTSVAFDQTGGRLFTSCIDGQVRVWSTTDGAMLAEMPVGGDRVSVVACSPVHNYCASISDESDDGRGDTHGTLSILKNTTIVCQVPVPPATQYRVRWSQDGRFLVIGTDEGVTVFSIVEEEPIRFWDFPMPTPILSADWSPDGSKIIVGSTDNHAYIISFQSDNPPVDLGEHEDWIWDVEWHQHADQFITVSSDGSIGVWSASDKTRNARLGKFSRGVAAVAWSPDARVIASSSADGHFCLWDVERRIDIGEFAAHKNWIRAIQFSKDGRRFLSASQDGSIRLWSSTTGNAVSEPIDPKTGGLWAAVWTHDNRIAAVSSEGFLSIIEPSTRSPAASYLIEDTWLRGVSWANDGSLVAVCGMSGLVHVASTENFSRKWAVNLGVPCFACAFSADSRYLAVALADGTIRFFSAAEGSHAFQFEGHTSEVWSVAFSSDGKTLASAGADGTIRTWSIPSRKCLRVFQLETSCISVSFSAHGEILVGSTGAWTFNPKKSDLVPGEHAVTLTDSPVAILDGPAKLDMLGRGALVEELAFFLHRAAEYSRELVLPQRLPEGFAVHIGGRWGSGKTSIVNHLVERVRHDVPPNHADGSADESQHWEPVYFSAWSAAGLAPAWWSIAMAIRSHILERLRFHKRATFRIKELFFRYYSLFLRPGILSVVSLLLLGLYYYRGRLFVGSGLDYLIPASSKDSGLPFRDGLSLIADIIGIGLPLLATIISTVHFLGRAQKSSKWPRPETSRANLDTEVNFSELPRKYSIWLRRQLGHDLLLVVDDLDRCPHEYIDEVLSSIHLMATADYQPVAFQNNKKRKLLKRLPALAIIVASDRRWLELPAEIRSKVIDPKWTTNGKSVGYEFLEKIFVASIDLPQLQSTQRQTLVHKYVGSRGAALNIDQLPQNRDQSNINTSDEAERVQKIKANIEAIDRPNKAQEAKITSELTTLDPVNQDKMHTELVRRMNEPKYRQYEESQLLEDFAALMDTTPRGIKRTLVTYWLNRTLIRLLDLDGIPSDESVMRWTILTLRWPLVAEKVSPIETMKKEAKRILHGEDSDFLAILGDSKEVVEVGMALRA